MEIILINAKIKILLIEDNVLLMDGILAIIRTLKDIVIIVANKILTKVNNDLFTEKNPK